MTNNNLLLTAVPQTQFSYWTISDSSNTPTAVSLQSFSAQTSTAWLPIFAAVTLLLGLVGVAKRPRRTNQDR